MVLTKWATAPLCRLIVPTLDRAYCFGDVQAACSPCREQFNSAMQIWSLCMIGHGLFTWADDHVCMMSHRVFKPQAAVASNRRIVWGFDHTVTVAALPVASFANGHVFFTQKLYQVCVSPSPRCSLHSLSPFGALLFPQGVRQAFDSNISLTPYI